MHAYNATETIQEAKKRLARATIAVIDSYTVPVAEELLDAAKKLRYVCLLPTGFDKVDLGAAHARGIKISNIPEYAATAVAEHTFALLFSLVRNVIPLNSEMKKRPFDIDQTDLTKYKFIGAELRNKKMAL